MTHRSQKNMGKSEEALVYQRAAKIKVGLNWGGVLCMEEEVTACFSTRMLVLLWLPDRGSPVEFWGVCQNPRGYQFAVQLRCYPLGQSGHPKISIRAKPDPGLVPQGSAIFCFLPLKHQVAHVVSRCSGNVSSRHPPCLSPDPWFGFGGCRMLNFILDFPK